MSENINAVVRGTVNPALLAQTYGLIGRGVKNIILNDGNELVFVMSDGSEINIGVISGGDTAFKSEP